VPANVRGPQSVRGAPLALDRVLYDHRDDAAELARLVVLRSPVFRDVVEMERNTLSLRSRKLFTLSAIYSATCALIAGSDGDVSFDQKRRSHLSSGGGREAVPGVAARARAQDHRR